MLLAILGAFGFGALGGLEYAGYNSAPKDRITTEVQINEGTYGYINAEDILAAFAFNGGDNSAVSTDGVPQNYKYQFVVSQIGGSLVSVRIPKSQNKLLDSADNKIYGTFLPADEEILSMLRTWAAQSIWSNKDAIEIGKHTPALTFTVGYIGYQPSWLGKLLFYLFSGLSLFSVLMVFRAFSLYLKLYDYADYPDGNDFGKHLHIAHNNIWIFLPFQEITVKRPYIEEVVPRNRRVEGGNLKWTLVFVTKQKLYTVPMPSKEVTQQAVDYYKETVRNQSTGNFRNKSGGGKNKR
jgi:hypothetical protein